eukprot:235440_1
MKDVSIQYVSKQNWSAIKLCFNLILNMSTVCRSFCRSHLLLLSLVLWIGFQFMMVYKHSEHTPTGNPHLFVDTFNVIGITKTNLHSKTFEYWMNWLNKKTIKQIGNKTFSLLHFDYHSNYDITHDSIQTCSPKQLIYYHQLVEQVLESVQDLIYPINKNNIQDIIIENISQYVYQYGYINEIIWIYPDYWS